MSGLVWRGPLFGVAGYAQEAREFVLGLDALGVRVRVEDVPLGPYPDRLAPETERRLRTLLRTRIDGDAARIEHGFPPRWSAGARAGRTMFETDRLPADWVPICNSVPDVWVPSRFNLETFAAAGVERERLHVLPGPIRVADWQEADPLELPTREFTFLSVFDWSLRRAGISARGLYGRVQPRRRRHARPQIHSSLGRTGAELRELVADAAGHRAPPIHVLVGVLPARDLPGLYRAADCLCCPRAARAAAGRSPRPWRRACP